MDDRPRPDVTHDGWDRYVVANDGVSIGYYRRPADGPSLVAVHGITAWGPNLFALATALDAFDVVVPDVRGHGRSDAPETGYDLATAAADLRTVVEDAQVSDPVLLGHSLGGGIVTAYAARHPVRAVVAIDPVGLLGGDGDGAREWVPTLIEEGRRSLQDGRSDAASGAPFASLRVQEFIESAHADPTERYAHIDCPVLVLRADVPKEERRDDESSLVALSDGRVEYISGAGHSVHRDNLDRTVEHVQAFLSNLD